MAIYYGLCIEVESSNNYLYGVSNWSTIRPLYISDGTSANALPDNWLSQLAVNSSTGKKYALLPLDESIWDGMSAADEYWLHNNTSNISADYTVHVSAKKDLYLYYSNAPNTYNIGGYNIPYFEFRAYWGVWRNSSSGFNREINNKNDASCGPVSDDVYFGTSLSGTKIVKLKSEVNTTGSGYGGVAVTTQSDSNITNFNITGYSTTTYNFTDQTYEGSGAVVKDDGNYGYNSTSQTKIFALHNVLSSSTDMRMVYCIGSMATNMVPTYAEYRVTSDASKNTWLEYSESTNEKYYAITTNSSLSSHVSVSISVTLGKKYTFQLHTCSEASFDGIALTPTSQSKPSKISDYIDLVGSCSGADVSQTVTYTPTATGTLYMYFTQDGSVFGYSNHNTGDVQLNISTADNVMVTLNKDGGTGGSNSFTTRPGASASSISISVPSKSNATFLGYYTSDGVQMINSSGKGTMTWNIVSAVTLYAHWQVTGYTVTLDGHNATSTNHTTSVVIANGTAASDYPSITLPTKTGYTFLGYWDAITGGTCYYTTSGTGNRTFDKTADCTLWAHWKPNITNSYYDAFVYCSSQAVAHTSTQSSQTVQIASSAPSATVGTVTTTLYSVNGSTSISGWSLSSDKKTLTVPSGKSAGTYTVVIRITVSGSAPDYESNTVDVSITLTIYANAISSYGTLTVSHTTPITLDGGGEAYVLEPSSSQPATWNNGASSTISNGASYTYATTTSCTGFERSGNTVYATENPGSTTRGPFVVTITGSANGKTGTKAVTFNQDVGVTYDDPEITAYSYVWFYASGETRNALNQDTLEYRQVKHTGSTTETITTGGTVTFYTTGTLPSGFSTDSDFSSTGSVTWADRTNVAGDERHAESYLYAKVTMNGKTSEAFYCTSCYQEANVLAWQTPSTPSHSTPITMAVSGQTYTCAPSSTQQQKYTSGYVVQTVNVTNFTYTVATSKDGYSLDDTNGKVTVTNNMSTSARNGFKINIKASQNGKTSSEKAVIFNQAAGSQGYLAPVITGYLYPEFPASGATQTPSSVTYSQEYVWNGVSGDGTVVTTGGTLAYYTDGTLPSGLSTASGFSTTGNITWANRTNVEGSVRTAEDYLYVKVTMNGLTSNPYYCDGCSQEANALGTTKYKNTSGTSGYNITSYGTPSSSLKIYVSTLTAAGGTYYIQNCSATDNISYYLKYTSGTYSALQTGTTSGTARWRITSQTFTPTGGSATTITRFSHPTSGGSNYTVGGSTVTLYPGGSSYKGSHSTMADNIGTDSITITAYNTGDTTKTRSKTATITNAVVSLVLSVANEQIGVDETTTHTVEAQCSSGSTKDVTADSSYSYNTDIVSIQLQGDDDF